MEDLGQNNQSEVRQSMRQYESQYRFTKDMRVNPSLFLSSSAGVAPSPLGAYESPPPLVRS